MTDVLNTPGERTKTVRARKPAVSMLHKLKPLAGTAVAAATGALVAGLFLSGQSSPVVSELDYEAALPITTEQPEEEGETEEVVDPEVVDAYETHVPKLYTDSAIAMPTPFGSPQVDSQSYQQPTPYEQAPTPSIPQPTPVGTQHPAPEGTPAPNYEPEVRAKLTEQALTYEGASYDTATAFTQAVYGAIGFKLPSTVDEQANAGVVTEQPVAGDLVIYPGQHVGIYAGNGYMWHAPGYGATRCGSSTRLQPPLNVTRYS